MVIIDQPKDRTIYSEFIDEYNFGISIKTVHFSVSYIHYIIIILLSFFLVVLESHAQAKYVCSFSIFRNRVGIAHASFHIHRKTIKF